MVSRQIENVEKKEFNTTKEEMKEEKNTLLILME